MQWQNGQESDNVDDVRGSSGGGGGGGGFAIGGRGLGLGAILVALAGSYFFGIDPSVILNLLSGGGGGSIQTQAPPVQAPAPRATGAAEDPQIRFVRVILKDTEENWAQMFSQMGGTYRPPRLEVYSGSYPTACGQGNAAAGPFYCPGDEKVYLDLDFFRMLDQRFHAPGQFAEAYVIAHEIGHHVQKLSGITAKTDAMRQRMSATDYNKVSVRIELQADCFAGVWGHRLATGQSAIKLDTGDVDEALKAANAIGDDTLQRQARGTVVPDSFTHGTSAERVAWFKRGMDSGDVRQCDTFSAASL